MRIQILSENLKVRDYLEGVGVYLKVIFDWTLGKWGSKVRTAFIRLRIS
jgi:hypothetical protein